MKSERDERKAARQERMSFSVLVIRLLKMYCSHFLINCFVPIIYFYTERNYATKQGPSGRTAVPPGTPPWTESVRPDWPWLIICCKTCQNICFWTCTNSDCTVRLHMSAFCTFYSCLVYWTEWFLCFAWKLSYQPCTNKEDVNFVDYIVVKY